jgi:L-threonylcarbamoyladenylate synthase
MEKTQYLQVDTRNPEPAIIEQAARYIRAGKLVAFPTETVYGLGADTFQPSAVEKIFLAKGRPTASPLLVHVSNMAQVKKLTMEVSVIAKKLMDRFWPGPLSIILPALPTVPDIVRNGQLGVGLRMPSHPVALALIEATGPLAAPSANLYGRPSPTNAEHVWQDLDGKIAAVLDAGDTGAGMESTVIDLTSERCKVLRRGGTSVEALEQFLGVKIEFAGIENVARYKTNIQVVLSDNQTDYDIKLNAFLDQGLAIGVVHINYCPEHKIEQVKRTFNLSLSGLGMNLYSILREAEGYGIETLLIAPFDQEQAGAALMDRLRRAASQ